MFFYFVPPGTAPTFIVDISNEVDDWLNAIDCHESQFYHPERPRPNHLPHPREAFESYARYWGWQIGAKYGQAFLAGGPLKIEDPVVLAQAVTPRP
jgi:LmbE family N-acetylglucosaminyl deacetylase